MLSAKKIKHILLLVFLVSTLASCDKECYEADQFYRKVKTIYANGIDINNRPERKVFGSYNDAIGGELIEWKDTQMVASGDYFVIAISGGWRDVGGSSISAKEISKMPSCRLCFKKREASETDNCICGPIFDDATLVKNDGKLEVDWEPSKLEKSKTSLEENSSPPGDCTDQNSIELCRCKTPTANEKLIFFNDNKDSDYFTFSRDSRDKRLAYNSTEDKRLGPSERTACAFKMGVGLYIGLLGSSDAAPPVAYHLASKEVVCPIELKPIEDKDGKKKFQCIDKGGIDRSKFIYRSPGRAIFNRTKPGAPEVKHEAGDKVKLNIYDNYLSDNAGRYNVEFMRGVVSKESDGLLAGIIRTFDKYLFGNEKLGINVKKEGVVEFMYKAVLKDSIVRSVISISLIMYICFYGLAFFMGMTDFGKKEIMMRLLKIGLVVLFTSEKAWLMYDAIIVKFFKNGMDSLVGMVQSVFESNMDKTLASFSLELEDNSVAVDAGRKFIFIDSLIMDLLSKPNISRIFGLFWNKTDTGFPVFQFFALIYVPAILLLIIYFIYMVLDVALKYMINLLKICIGLALGPVFILFSLFEKTKDMFNNWLAFVAARSLEIVILFTMLHPFLKIIDQSFKDMLIFEVCGADLKTEHNFWNYSISYTKDTGRGIFDWFTYFLRIGALIFITKSICDKSGYISGQLISIGGVANADAITEVGRGESGFNMASSIAKGTFGLAKTALTNSKISQAGKFAGRLMIRNLTKIARSERLGINNMVNNAFKAVGIRNRGLRSYVRDREVDNAFNLASGDANLRGLEGKDRYDYIRQNAKNRISIFKNQNPNKAALLGLDEKNIQKRLDQKMDKEPLKEYIKQKGQELKNQGIIGKEAREMIKEGAEVWAKQKGIFSEGAAKRKVSEFFKKTSVDGALKSASEITASQATAYIGNLISTGTEENIKKADDFKDKFRKNLVEGKMEKYQQRKENTRTGGVIGKGLVGGINILGKIVQPLALAGKYGAKGINIVSTRAFNKKIINTRDGYGKFKLLFSKYGISKRIVGKNTLKAFGGIDNKVAKGRDRILGLLRYSRRDMGKELRKFDRKLARELSNPEIHEEIKGYNEKLKTPGDAQEFKGPKKPAFVSESEAVEKGIIKDRTFLRFKESDGTAKFIGKLLLKPILFAPNFALKKYYFYKSGGEKEEFKRLGRENQLSTLREMAKEEADKINGKLGAHYEKNLKIDEKTGEVKTEKDKTNALERLDKSKEQRDSMEKVALMMKKMEKTAKNQEKAEEKALVDEKIKAKNLAERAKIFLNMGKKEAEEASAKANQVEKLKKVDLGDKETVFERLSKMEEVTGVNSLKSEYVKAVGLKIEDLKSKNDLENLKALKGALFVSMDDLNKPELKELRSLFEKVLSSVSPATQSNNQSEKPRQLLDKIYEGEKIIAKAEADGNPPPVSPNQGGGQQAPDAPAQGGGQQANPNPAAPSSAPGPKDAPTPAPIPPAGSPRDDKAAKDAKDAKDAKAAKDAKDKLEAEKAAKDAPTALSPDAQAAQAAQAAHKREAEEDAAAAGLENLKKDNEFEKNVQAKVDILISSFASQGVFDVDYNKCTGIVRKIVKDKPSISDLALTNMVLTQLNKKELK